MAKCAIDQFQNVTWDPQLNTDKFNRILSVRVFFNVVSPMLTSQLLSRYLQINEIFSGLVRHFCLNYIKSFMNNGKITKQPQRTYEPKWDDLRVFGISVDRDHLIENALRNLSISYSSIEIQHLTTTDKSLLFLSSGFINRIKNRTRWLGYSSQSRYSRSHISPTEYGSTLMSRHWPL